MLTINYSYQVAIFETSQKFVNYNGREKICDNVYTRFFKTIKIIIAFFNNSNNNNSGKRQLIYLRKIEVKDKGFFIPIEDLQQSIPMFQNQQDNAPIFRVGKLGLGDVAGGNEVGVVVVEVTTLQDF